MSSINIFSIRLLVATTTIYLLVILCFGETNIEARLIKKIDVSEYTDIREDEKVDEPESIAKLKPMQMLAAKGDKKKDKKKKDKKDGKDGKDGEDGEETEEPTKPTGKMDVFVPPGKSTTPQVAHDDPEAGNHTTTTKKPKKCRGANCKIRKNKSTIGPRTTTIKATHILVTVTDEPTTLFYVFDGVDYEDDELFAKESKDCEGRYTTCAVDSERIYPVCGYLTTAAKKIGLVNPYYMWQSLCDLEYNNCVYRYYYFKTGFEGTGISNNRYELVAMDNCVYDSKTASYGALELPYDIP